VDSDKQSGLNVVLDIYRWCGLAKIWDNEYIRDHHIKW